jgi:hypothetical protein
MPMYFRLGFLGAMFISGIWAWSYAGNYAAAMSSFMKDLFTLNSGIAVTVPLSVHIIITLLFIIYLPFTDMLHFIAKYFTYHAVRWNDEPLDEKMDVKLRALIGQPTGWQGPHAAPGKSWGEIASGEKESAEKA